MSLFGVSGDAEYEALVAENSFVSAIQLAIESSLKTYEMSQAELARRLGVSEARVSQILSSNGKNLQARTVARIAHALGLKALIDFVDAEEAWSTSASSGETTFRGSFSDWVKSACEAVEADTGWVRGENDNFWSLTEQPPAFEKVVAA